MSQEWSSNAKEKRKIMRGVEVYTDDARVGKTNKKYEFGMIIHCLRCGQRDLKESERSRPGIITQDREE
jgi:hypothetical protein